MGQKLAIKVHPISGTAPKVYLLDVKYKVVLSSALPPAVLNTQLVYLTVGVEKGVTYSVKFYITLEVYGDAESSEFSPYAETATSFTLPAEHPYLAKLPDGTADEIKVDRDGNVSLIANVGRMTLTEFGGVENVVCTDMYEAALAANKVSGFRVYNNEKPASRYAVCTSLQSVKEIWNAGEIGIRWVDGLLIHYPWDVLGITVDDSYDTRNDKFKTYATDKTDIYIYYSLGNNTKKTYNLGKITLPALPESTSNVWTDAELTPNTTIEYIKDVNIVIARIEDAIASIG